MMIRDDMTAQVRAALARGDITVAAVLCRDWRAADPAAGEAFNLSGIAALQGGEIQQALDFFTRATQLAPADARAWSNLAIASRQAGKDMQMIADCFRQAWLLAPANPDICYNLALAQHDQGLNREALATLDAWPAEAPLAEKAGWLKASALHALGLRQEARDVVKWLTDAYPQRHDFWRALGDLHRELGAAVEAESAYRLALQLAPDDLEAARGLGNLLVNLGRAEEGRPLLRRNYEQMGDRVDAHIEYAQALAASGIFLNARQVLEAALERWPDNAELHFNLGLIDGEHGESARAEASVGKAIDLAPHLFLAHNYLGVLLEKRGLGSDAESCYRHAIALAPEFPEAYSNLANLLAARLQLDDAETAYRKAIALKPDLAEAHHNLGLLLLLTERYREGWAEYQWRWRTSDAKPHIRAFEQPSWQGEEIAGQRLLVHAEQGFGDTIQFVRYMPELAKRGITVLFEAPPALERLFRGVPGISLLFKRGAPIPEYDRHVSLLDIPGLVGTTAENMPSAASYLYVDAEASERWARRIAQRCEGRFSVGIVWAGNPKHARDRERSIPNELLSVLAAVENVQWVSLYKPTTDAVRQAPPPLPMLDWTAELADYSETAALIAELDLVIAVDTSVAHLAGAMGKPVWILLPYVPDWRWMLNRDTTPWYPSATLYRQSRPGAWPEVIDAVLCDLQQSSERMKAHH